MTKKTRRESKRELFLKLSQPDENGFSRWVGVGEFVGEYAGLQLGNGGSWCRKSSSLAKEFNVIIDKKQTPGNSIDRIRLAGFKKEEHFSQYIRQDIRDFYKNKKCVMLGVCGESENTIIEIDHKEGRKNNMRISKAETQELEDFQPLCKAANDIKRQICKHCRAHGKRWDAKNIKGNPYSFYAGTQEYTKEQGCKGCYQYDPVEYRKSSLKMIIKEATENTSEYIFKKLYGDEK